MADHHARELEESFMNVSTPFVAHAQAAQVMEPGESALDNPAAFAKSAAMSNTAPGQKWPDAALSQLTSMGLRIVSAVALHRFGTLARSGRLRGWPLLPLTGGTASSKGKS